MNGVETALFIKHDPSMKAYLNDEGYSGDPEMLKKQCRWPAILLNIEVLKISTGEWKVDLFLSRVKLGEFLLSLPEPRIPTTKG